MTRCTTKGASRSESISQSRNRRRYHHIWLVEHLCTWSAPRGSKTLSSVWGKSEKLHCWNLKHKRKHLYWSPALPLRRRSSLQILWSWKLQGLTTVSNFPLNRGWHTDLNYLKSNTDGSQIFTYLIKSNMLMSRHQRHLCHVLSNCRKKSLS